MSGKGLTVLGDWGSTRLRLWLMHGREVLASAEQPGRIVSALPPVQTLAAGLAAIGGTSDADRIVLCGMAGARGGLVEAAYAPCPAGCEDWLARAVQTRHGGAPCHVLPGFSCRNHAGRADVMRGEETQVFGALALDPALAEGAITVVLPGTHSKWVQVEHGTITGFATALTGELHARLAGSSVLPAGGAGDAAEESNGFAAGLARAAAGDALGIALFEARAAQMLDGRSEDWARGFVSGLLIGAEIAALAPAANALLVLVGDPRLTARYSAALAQFGLAARAMDGDMCVREGLELASGL